VTTKSEPVAVERSGALEGLKALPAASHARAATFAMFDRIVELAARIFDVPMVGINILRGDIQVTAAGLGAIETGQVTPREESFCDHTIRTPGPLVVADARADSRFSANPSVTGDPNFRFLRRPAPCCSDRRTDRCAVSRR
jgi:GAF domain-containing protein